MSQSRGDDGLRREILWHIQHSLGDDPEQVGSQQVFQGLARAVRSRLIDSWLSTQRACDDLLAKRVYYLSMEFLPGRFLSNYLCALGIEEEAREALGSLGFELDDVEEEEWDAGLGNGGLGRLASCFLDSMATMHLSACGYGIRYDYGIFHQVIVDGYQTEQPDNWMREGSPWEIQRPEIQYPIRFCGRSEAFEDEGVIRYRWVDTQSVLAMAADILIPGFGGEHVTHMRLWVARSSMEFSLEEFNQGDYAGAVESKVLSENISKVLYPSDELEEGRELRLKQQFFFVGATLQDILLRFKAQYRDWARFPDAVAIQLNDTHPSIAIPELMRLLVDEERLDWDDAWELCQKTFAYTNHTVLPEALETWPVELLGRLLPRHLEIIYEINHRFLRGLRAEGLDGETIARLSLIQEGPVRRVRMAHLAIVGSHSVNGVAELHSRILRDQLFFDFHRVFPGRFRNVTNGVTPRRWLSQSNPGLSELITSAIGEAWIRDLERLRQLEEFVGDAEFRRRWARTRMDNKKRLARYVLRKVGLGVNPETLFDVQVKRIHEYKRQLLNVLHVVSLYNRIRTGGGEAFVPRTVFIGGKAAPAYHQAKLIIKLINSVAAVVNKDPEIKGCLRVVFLPNYCVSQAEKVIPAADLSEQISTAGMEASGTGNMKFALNGALTIGTLDGANVEILEEVGQENIFIFGLTSEEVVSWRRAGYSPREVYENDMELRSAFDLIRDGYFSPERPDLFQPILRSLLDWGDFYMVLADFRAYVEAQERADCLYREPEDWTRRSILNTARTGRFSSDRAISDYAREIWEVSP